MTTATTATSPPWSDPTRSCPILVGISGWARSGKDSLAASLIECHGYRRLAFADRVKTLTGRLYPEIGARAALEGWEAAKADPAVRCALQLIGVAVRDVLGESTWVNAAFADLDPDGRYVVTDLRFPNEAVALREGGAVLVRITRPGVGPVNDDITETALNDWADWDVEVANDGSLDDLAGHADRLAVMAALSASAWSEEPNGNVGPALAHSPAPDRNDPSREVSG